MYEYKAGTTSNWYLWILRGAIVIVFLVFFGRLFDLQVIRGAYFRELADNNRIREIPIAAARGKILDRNGEILVDNSLIEKIVVFDERNGFTKQIAKDADGGENMIEESIRKYPLGSAFGHISGYIGETREEEVGKARADCSDKGYRKIGTYVGRTGIEEMYDCVLSGIDGEEIVEVDSTGKRVRTLGRRLPIAGQDIKTHINGSLQKTIASVFGNKRGAAVAMTANGEVLALYSAPSYDPTAFVQSNSTLLTSYFSDKNLPLFNRATGGLYHPGSVYKPLIGIAALETGAIDKDYTFDDQGVISVTSDFGNYSFSNWYFTQYGGKEGVVGMERALARSTDTYFYKVGELLGIDNIVEWSKYFGLHEKTGIDIPGEVEGLVPSPAWKMQTKGERWFLGNTYHLSIGQGDLAVTPIAINRVTTAITNGGKLCVPKIVGDTTCQDLPINESNRAIVIEGMKQTCLSGGTAYPFFDFEKSVACKTGTAETLKPDVTHAWFTIAAPADNPEIILTILVEEGGEGSRDAAPLAREILDQWFLNISK
jgi:penicillin-binding protein 2